MSITGVEECDREGWRKGDGRVEGRCLVVSVCQLLSRCALRPWQKEIAIGKSFGTLSRAHAPGDFLSPHGMLDWSETNSIHSLKDLNTAPLF